jgi:hypothetical protein
MTIQGLLMSKNTFLRTLMATEYLSSTILKLNSKDSRGDNKLGMVLVNRVLQELGLCRERLGMKMTMNLRIYGQKIPERKKKKDKRKDMKKLWPKLKIRPLKAY